MIIIAYIYAVCKFFHGFLKGFLNFYEGKEEKEYGTEA